MALEDPTRDEITKFCLVVSRSLRVVGDALGLINDLTLAGFDMADKVCH